mgnify:CR=1 FL=1
MKLTTTQFKGMAILSVLLLGTIPAYADHEDPPKFTQIHDLFVPTQRPTPVNFEVIAIDYAGQNLKVECDQYSGHIFPVGRTKVHCMATDDNGKEVRSHFIVTVGYEIVNMPTWFKETTKFWLAERITDQDYFNSLEYLLKKDIMIIPTAKLNHDNTSQELPSWIIKVGEDWANNKTGNHEYSIAIGWLVENGFISTK